MMRQTRPASLQSHFREVADVGDDLEQLAQINRKFSIDMKMGSVPTL